MHHFCEIVEDGEQVDDYFGIDIACYYHSILDKVGKKQLVIECVKRETNK